MTDTVLENITMIQMHYIYTCILQIADVFVGNAIDALLDRADPDLSLSPVVVEFRKFLKIVVTLHEDTTSAVTHSESAGRNAFDVMRQAMHEQTKARTPSRT